MKVQYQVYGPKFTATQNQSAYLQPRINHSSSMNAMVISGIQYLTVLQSKSLVFSGSLIKEKNIYTKCETQVVLE